MAAASWKQGSSLNFRSAFEAVHENDANLLRNVLSSGDADQDSLIQLLCSAVEQKHYACVLALLEGKADPYAKPESSHANALHRAVVNDDVEALRMLTRDLENEACDKDAEEKTSARHTALLARRIRPINEALMDAIRLGSLQCMIFLVSLGADIEVLLYQDDEFLSWCRPLMSACYVSRDLDQASRKWKNTDEMVRILLNRGVDVNARSENGKTALIFAASSGLVNVIHMLLERGANVNEVQLRLESTPLMLAIEANPPNILEVATILVTAGADVNAIDRAGWRALNFATDNGNCRLVELLLKHGALPDNPDAPSALNVLGSSSHSNNHQATAPDSPLYSACGSGNVELVKLLLRYGGDFNARRIQFGRTTTAFARAMETGNSVICLLLLEAGFDRSEAIRIMAPVLTQNRGHLNSGYVSSGIMLRVVRAVEASFATVSSLKNLCRLTIRRSMKNLRHMNTLTVSIERNTVTLPHSIVEYLSLNDI